MKTVAGIAVRDNSSSGVATVKPALLQMWLGNELVEQVPMKYGHSTATYKRHLQERAAADLLTKHETKVIKSGLWPVFFVVQQSKM